MKVKRQLVCFIICGLMIFLSGLYSSSSAAPSKGTYSKSTIKKRIVKEARRQGLCPYLALSIAKQESGFNCHARSPAGAIGLFQLMPLTARDLRVNPHCVDQNIHGGIKYLKFLRNKFGSDRLAIAAYNAGPGCVQKYGGIPPYKETRDYVRYVMKFYKQYKRDLKL